MNNDNQYENILKNGDIKENDIPWNLIESYFENKHLKLSCTKNSRAK